MKPGDLVRVKYARTLTGSLGLVLGIVIGPSERLRGHVDVCFNNKIWNVFPGDLELVDDQTLL
jgi:hypothetical protein